MNTYKTSKTLLPSLENVLKRRGVEYEVLDQENSLSVKVNLSGEKFHKAVVRAKMELLQKERGSSIPYVAECEITDKYVADEVGNAFTVIRE